MVLTAGAATWLAAHWSAVPAGDICVAVNRIRLNRNGRHNSGSGVNLLLCGTDDIEGVDGRPRRYSATQTKSASRTLAPL